MNHRHEFIDLPAQAAWRHVEARDAFEVLFLHAHPDGFRFEGHTAALQEGEAWVIGYDIQVDTRWVTRRARVFSRSRRGHSELVLESEGDARWRVNGAHVPHLDGCLDVDLESSAFTNAFPVHRLGLAMGQMASAPACYVRAMDLSVERLEQEYRRTENEGPRQRFDYRSPAFGTHCILTFDASGLVLDYPEIATRVL